MKYKIYTGNNKFHITYNVAIYSIFAFCIFLALLKKYLFKNIEFPILEKIFFWIAMLNLIFCLIMTFARFSLHKPFKGNLDSFLELKENEVIIKNQSHSLNEIKEIEIWNFDFLGELEINYSKGNFNGALSNGVENQFKVTLLNGKIIDLNFQQEYGNQLKDSKTELITYYRNGKLSFSNLARVFDCKDEIDIETFRKTLS